MAEEYKNSIIITAQKKLDAPDLNALYPMCLSITGAPTILANDIGGLIAQHIIERTPPLTNINRLRQEKEFNQMSPVHFRPHVKGEGLEQIISSYDVLGVSVDALRPVAKDIYRLAKNRGYNISPIYWTLAIQELEKLPPPCARQDVINKGNTRKT